MNLLVKISQINVQKNYKRIRNFLKKANIHNVLYVINIFG